ncbi:MAG: YgiT-type zinc finger protein [Candidatus Thermoplasmatota archaeon]|nr:YgiT-type zinc finger protein [Candidatus Thermoplasmatota archaeon]
MIPFPKCPVCGGEVRTKIVEKLIRGGVNMASVKVEADVCLKCGERMYQKEDIVRFEMIRENLIREDVNSYLEIGRSYQIA